MAASIACCVNSKSIAITCKKLSSVLISDATIRNSLLASSSSSLSQVRFGGKINIQRPKIGPVERRIMVAVTRPIIPKMKIDPALTCSRRKSLMEEKKQLSQYQQFLVKHQKKVIDENKNGILALFHVSPVSAKQRRKMTVFLKQNGFMLYRLNPKILKLAIEGTKYETLMVPVFGETQLISCSEPKVKELLAAVKKLKDVYLLGGIVEEQLQSKADMERYASYPDVAGMLGQTCAILNMAQQRIRQLLTHHQTLLSRNLDQLSKGDNSQSECAS